MNQAKKDLKKKERELEEIEDSIMKLEEEKAGLEKQLADPAVFQDEEQSQKVNKAYEELRGKEQSLTAQWEQIAEEIQELQEVVS